MPATQLQFYQVGSYPYPYATTGTGSALTVCRRYNDPYLAFLTQTSYEDEIVFLYLHSSVLKKADAFRLFRVMMLLAGWTMPFFEILFGPCNRHRIKTSSLVSIRRPGTSPIRFLFHREAAQLWQQRPVFCAI